MCVCVCVWGGQFASGPIRKWGGPVYLRSDIRSVGGGGGGGGGGGAIRFRSDTKRGGGGGGGINGYNFDQGGCSSTSRARANELKILFIL